MNNNMQFAVVGIPEMSESQKELRAIYPEDKIRRVKAAEILPDLVMVKKNPVPKGSKIKAV